MYNSGDILENVVQNRQFSNQIVKSSDMYGRTHTPLQISDIGMQSQPVILHREVKMRSLKYFKTRAYKC